MTMLLLLSPGSRKERMTTSQLTCPSTSHWSKVACTLSHRSIAQLCDCMWPRRGRTIPQQTAHGAQRADVQVMIWFPFDIASSPVQAFHAFIFIFYGTLAREIKFHSVPFPSRLELEAALPKSILMISHSQVISDLNRTLLVPVRRPCSEMLTLARGGTYFQNLSHVHLPVELWHKLWAASTMVVQKIWHMVKSTIAF